MKKSLAFWTLPNANSHFLLGRGKNSELKHTLTVKRELINMTRAWNKEKI